MQHTRPSLSGKQRLGVVIAATWVTLAFFAIEPWARDRYDGGRWQAFFGVGVAPIAVILAAIWVYRGFKRTRNLDYAVGKTDGGDWVQREVISSVRLLDWLNSEVNTQEACKNCSFTSISRLQEAGPTGCNWSTANLRCSGASGSVCAPIANRIYEEAQRRFNVE